MEYDPGLELSRAQGLDAEKLAGEIRDIGFECRRCGECCRGEDEHVAVFPFEVRALVGATGLKWLDVAAPPESQDIDMEGNMHSFEWVLRRANGNCRFLGCGCKECTVYGARPLLCRTYPFFIDGERLQVSKCRGLGSPISVERSLELAQVLKLRLITEIEETVRLFSRFRGFRMGSRNQCVKERGKGSWRVGRPGNGTCIVHDSAGTWVIRGREFAGRQP
ncbi:MAG TPA: YkgJ family cysteine cluster protein [Candidatus Methanoperedenaceae archaeon]|nr:YkgJ family cysteine cluster protein [Candidatus Methanoperedenaceae archaeon]